jgi:hypothetical protein
MAPERYTDANWQPDESEILAGMGRRAQLWASLRDYLAERYDHVSEWDFGGAKYGWSCRYRRGGRTLVTLFPERGSFTALVVLGKDEAATAEGALSGYSARVRSAFTGARQLRDGRWLWIRPVYPKDVGSVIDLLALKRRPKNPV